MFIVFTPQFMSHSSHLNENKRSQHVLNIKHIKKKGHEEGHAWKRRLWYLECMCI